MGYGGHGRTHAGVNASLCYVSVLPDTLGWSDGKDWTRPNIKRFQNRGPHTYTCSYSSTSDQTD
jgi:hypothetical protein